MITLLAFNTQSRVLLSDDEVKINIFYNHIDCLLNIQSRYNSTKGKSEKREKYMIRYSHTITQGEGSSSTVQKQNTA